MNLAKSYGSGGFSGVGVGFSHDLGGGAMLVAGLARVPWMSVEELSMTKIGQVANGVVRKDLSGDRNVAGVGLSFTL